jgi:tetratricopeptide (TPR) repeat protein
MGNRINIANSLWMLGCVAAEQGHFAQAETLLDQSLALSREMGDMTVTFGALRELALALTWEGKYSRAVSLYEECLAVARYARFRVGVSWATAGLGFAVLGEGDLARAEVLFRQSVEMASKQDNNRLADSLEGLAEVEMKAATSGAPGAEAQQRLRRAATLIGAAVTLRRTLNTQIIPARAVLRDRVAAEVRALLAAEVYDQSYRAGQAMSFEEAVAYALSPPLRHET